MPQEAYKTARKQKEFGGLRVIEFYVYGEKGIRLSDALGENWAGLEDRDNRSFFDDDRAQIMIRLHVSLPAIIQAPRLTSTTNLASQPVGCPSWQSKVKPNKLFLSVLSHTHSRCMRRTIP